MVSDNSDRSTVICTICNTSLPPDKVTSSQDVKESVVEYIQELHPHWNVDEPLCLQCLNRIQLKYIEDAIESERQQIIDLNEDFLKTVRRQKLPGGDVMEAVRESQKVGAKVADKVASFGGSWKFIISFALFVTLWVIGNGLLLRQYSFDPYPFIFLNLAFSAIAAF